MKTCQVCGKEKKVFSNNSGKQDFLAEVPICLTCARLPGEVERWAVEHSTQASGLPICSVCWLPILEKGGWVRAKADALPLCFHKACVETVLPARSRPSFLCSGMGGT